MQYGIVNGIKNLLVEFAPGGKKITKAIHSLCLPPTHTSSSLPKASLPVSAARLLHKLLLRLQDHYNLAYAPAVCFSCFAFPALISHQKGFLSGWFLFFEL